MKSVVGGRIPNPLQVRAEHRNQLALRWLINAARSEPMHESRPRNQDAAQNQGEAVRKKMDVQRMAEANRAFAHFAK